MFSRSIFVTLAAGLIAASMAGCVRADAVADGQAYVKANCVLCHDVSVAKTVKQGPPLFGVVGRKVGSAGYGYSDALKQAGSQGKTWTPAELNAFLADPQTAMPGTLMPVNVPDAKKRKAVIAYLATLKDGAAKPAATEKATQAAMGPKGPAAAGLDWHNDAPGVRHHIDAADLPAPFATPSAGNGPSTLDAGKAAPRVTDGFTVGVFASDADHPRQLRTAPSGDLFAVEEGAGRIVVYANDHGALKSTKTVFAEGLHDPFGVAFYPVENPQWVYVASTGSVVRYPYHSGDIKASGPAQTVVAHLATGGGHTTRDIVFTPDGKYMYVSVGSASNVAEEMDRTPPDGWVGSHGIGQPWGAEDGRAMVLRFKPDGSDRYVYADGIRNCVTLGLNAAEEVFCVTNERDGLGDNLVPDYFTHVQDGGYYGWPWYYLGDHEDPRLAGARPDLKGKAIVPDLLFESHSAPLGFTFYHAPAGAQHAFPKAYDGDAFVALHGSWNRAQRTGSKIVRVFMKDGRPTGDYEDFMTGLIIDDKHVAGRPVGVAVGPDGALYVADDAGSKIWRIAPK